MNYRHVFHAGNFADVFKHAILVRVLDYLVRKPAPLRFIDTHAGIGRYDLAGQEASRTGEWRGGIGRPALRAAPPAVAALLAPYFDVVWPAGGDEAPGSYPGSPVLAQALLRPQDRIVLCELHPADADALEIAVGRDKRVTVLRLDGYRGLKASVPPPERRGAVLIDPPFEDRDEFDRMLDGFLTAYRKWPTGTYLLWYPVKDLGAVARLAEALPRVGVRRVLQLHLSVAKRIAGEGPLAGAGLLAVNPPFRLKQEAETILPFLAGAFGGDEGGWSCRTLAGE